MAAMKDWRARLSSVKGAHTLWVTLCGAETPSAQLGRDVRVYLNDFEVTLLARALGKEALAPVLDELKRRADLARSMAGDDEGYDNFDEAENYGAAQSLDEAYALLQEFVNGTFPKR